VVLQLKDARVMVDKWTAIKVRPKLVHTLLCLPLSIEARIAHQS
jgi:hypothetical protein